MSHVSKSSHRSRRFPPSPFSLGGPYSPRSPTDDHELYPDDSSSMVSSNRSSHRSGGDASHISRSSHRSRRTSHRESNLRREMFERANLGPIREEYEESHHSQSSHRSGGRNSRALIRRDEDEYDDSHSHISRASRRGALDREIDITCSRLSRASLSAVDQNKALWAKRSRSRSRSVDSDEDAFHDTDSRISRRSPHRSASGPGSGYDRDDWATRRRRTTRSRSLSRERAKEQVSHADSMARGHGRGGALSHYERGVLAREDRARYRDNPPHTLGTGDLRATESRMSYTSGLDTRHFKAGDEVDVRSRKNIDRSADGAYSIHDEMDIKMRFGVGVVPGGGGGGGMSRLRGGSGGEDIADGAAASEDESAERGRYDGAPDRLDSGHRRGTHCTNKRYTCAVHDPPYGIMGGGYWGLRRCWWG